MMLHLIEKHFLSFVAFNVCNPQIFIFSVNPHMYRKWCHTTNVTSSFYIDSETSELKAPAEQNVFFFYKHLVQSRDRIHSAWKVSWSLRSRLQQPQAPPPLRWLVLKAEGERREGEEGEGKLSTWEEQRGPTWLQENREEEENSQNESLTALLVRQADTE